MKAARAIGTHSETEWRALVTEFKSRCVICWNRFDALEKDHITPICFGGSDSIENIQPACRSCNSGKPDSTNWKAIRRAAN